jgi:hypothetical protein
VRSELDDGVLARQVVADNLTVMRIRPFSTPGLSGLADFFFCSNSRPLRGGIANDYFAIKMPGSVAENRHNEGEAHEEGQRANH